MRTQPARVLVAVLGTSLALLGTLGVLRAEGQEWLLPSLGGSCVILFGMPRGVMAQPRSFFGGHVLATVIGLLARSLALWLGGPMEVWAMLAVGVALAAMMATRTIHSPAGANPLVVFATQAEWGFLVGTLLPGLIVLFVMALVANNLPRPWGAGPWPRFTTRMTRKLPVFTNRLH